MNDQNPEPNLLKRLQTGEKEAVKSLYKEIYPSLKPFLYQKGATAEESRELFQECLWVLFKNIQKPGFELHCTIKTYLFSVARNLWYKRVKSKQKVKTVDWENTHGLELLSFSDSEIPSKIQLEQDYHFVFRALEEVGENCRRVLELFYLERQPLREITVIMGYTENFVKIKKKRCLEAVKKLIASMKIEGKGRAAGFNSQNG